MLFVIAMFAGAAVVMVLRAIPLVRVAGANASSEFPLAATVSLGAQRTIALDPAFGVSELADIAIRALSPGVNEPGMAAVVLDGVHEVLHRVGAHRMSGAVCTDADGVPRAMRLCLPAARDQVEDEHRQRDHQHDVNQATGDIEYEARQPQSDKNGDDGPYHDFHLSLLLSWRDTRFLGLFPCGTILRRPLHPGRMHGARRVNGRCLVLHPLLADDGLGPGYQSRIRPALSLRERKSPWHA